MEQTEQVYIGLGSNLGDSRDILQNAINAMHILPNTKVCAISSLYASAPLGSKEQPRFLNAVAMLQTKLAPLELLDSLQAIEHKQGRVRLAERWGPRTLDLDIILFGQHNIDLPRLQVPHYHMQMRVFVLQPMAELCSGDFQLPDGRSLTTLLAACPQDDSMQRLEHMLYIPE